MKQNRIRLMEKLDRCFAERLRQSAEAGEEYPADLVEIYTHLKGTRLRDSEVYTLLRFSDPLRVALDCWRRNRNRYVFDICFWLARIEAERLCIQIIIIMPPPSPWGTPVRKRREMLTGGQQILYGGRVFRVPDR